MAVKTLLDTSSAAQFKFEKIGTKLQGYLVATEEFPLNGKLVRKHVFDTSTGLVGVLGSTGLNRGIDQLVNQHGLGLWVEVTYTGNMKTKQPIPMKVFSFGYDETNRTEVGQSLAPIASEEAGNGQLEDQAEEAEEIAEPVLPPARTTSAPASVNKDTVSRVQSVLNRNRSVR